MQVLQTVEGSLLKSDRKSLEILFIWKVLVKAKLLKICSFLWFHWNLFISLISLKSVHFFDFIEIWWFYNTSTPNGRRLSFEICCKKSLEICSFDTERYSIWLEKLIFFTKSMYLLWNLINIKQVISWKSLKSVHFGYISDKYNKR